MKKVILVSMVLINLLVMASGLAYGNKITSFTEVMNPEFIVSDGDHLYVAEGTTVYIYSLKDYKLIKKFGKKGQGPKEFGGKVARIVPKDDYILVNSPGKITFYTKEGIYIKEKKTGGAMSIPNYFPLKEGFVGAGMEAEGKKMYATVNLYDRDLKKGKTLVKYPMGNTGRMDVFAMASAMTFYVYHDSIYVLSETEDLSVFDKQGNIVLSIVLDKKKEPLSADDEKGIRKVMKKNMPAGVYERVKEMFVFPDFFPKLMSVFVSNDIAYLITFKKENEKYETLLYDQKGKLIKKIFLYIKLRDGIRPYPFDIKNGTLLQLIENEETEEWELHLNEI